jgi:hypothetical protein
VAHHVDAGAAVLAGQVGGHQASMPVVGHEDHFVTIGEPRRLARPAAIRAGVFSRTAGVQEKRACRLHTWHAFSQAGTCMHARPGSKCARLKPPMWSCRGASQAARLSSA